MTEDEIHEAYGCMIHTMSQPYRKMSDPGTIDAHNELARRARAYQARIAELEAEIQRLKANGD
jgi:hypothetical protein